MSTIDTRREQMFPKLEPREIDRLRRFGDVRRYSAGEALFVTGEIAPGMVVLTKGSLRVTRRDPLGHHAPMAEQGVGEFVAEVGQLSGQPAFVDVYAIDDVEALLIPPENLRALVIAEPELGERIMRALILRRVALVEAGAGAPVLIGPESAPDVIRLQGFLARNAYPHQLLDPTQDGDAAELVKQYAPNPADLPLAVCPKGSILKNPSETELAGELGMVPIDERERTYDVAIWQQRHDPSPLEIADNRSVAAIASKGPIVDADNGQRIGSWGCPASDNPKQRIVADRQHQPFGETRCWSAAECQPQMVDDAF